MRIDENAGNAGLCKDERRQAISTNQGVLRVTLCATRSTELSKLLLLLQRDACLHPRLHLVDDHSQDDDQPLDHLLPEG